MFGLYDKYTHLILNTVRGNYMRGVTRLILGIRIKDYLVLSIATIRGPRGRIFSTSFAHISSTAGAPMLYDCTSFLSFPRRYNFAFESRKIRYMKAKPARPAQKHMFNDFLVFLTPAGSN